MSNWLDDPSGQRGTPGPGQGPGPNQPGIGGGTVAGPQQYQQGPTRPGTGVAVGSWVPFANYLATQFQSGADPEDSGSWKGPPPKSPGGPEPVSPTGDGPPSGGLPGGGVSPGLVAGPGLGGYYGQLSQQYLTGKRQ